ncbi:universal stress protein [Streptomyces sp. NPDC059083]|uniref:universal stress protein n=1 Tax=unclassified Streptomyces TaxID=2593676 RepID=UPI0036C8131C
MTRPSPWGGGRIVVGVTGSLASLAALRHAASLARHAGAPLLAVLVWQPPEGEGLFARTPDRSWARLWGEDARRRLNEALLDGLGGVPEGLAFEGRVVRGAPASALCAVADRPGDLLVLGSAPGRGRFGLLRRRPVLRAVLRRATGPVLAVPGPILFPGEARVLRRGARVPAPAPVAEAGDGRGAGPSGAARRAF